MYMYIYTVLPLHLKLNLRTKTKFQKHILKTSLRIRFQICSSGALKTHLLKSVPNGSVKCKL